MTVEDIDFGEPPPPRRPLFRRKRVLIPLGVLLAIVAGFLLLLTPDTDRDAMIAKYGGPNATFAAGPAGQRIHYRDQGKRGDRAIILIHGANASLHTWEPLVKRLGATYRIVTLDLPGHGLTGAIPSRDYSASAMIEAVDVVAGEHGVGCAAVVAGFDLAIGADQHVRQFQGLFAVEGVGGVPGMMQADGIHPTAQAQPVLLENLWPTLKPLL